MAQQTNAKAPRPDIGEGGLRVARLTKPHGLKGGLKLELYTDNPDERFFAGAKFYLQVPSGSEWFGQTLTMSDLRYYNGQPVAFFAEVPDRTAAESIAKAILWIDEQTVLSVVEENAWYDHQLVGLSVHVAGAEVGKVQEVQHMPAQDLLVVALGDKTVLVPLVEAIVPEVNLETGIVTLTPPEGLFEEQ